MPQPNPTVPDPQRDLEAKAMLAELRLLHCETLQTEVERQQREIADLRRQLDLAVEPAVKAVSSRTPMPATGGDPLDGWGRLLESEAPPDRGVARSFLLACAARLMLQPASTLQRLTGEPGLARALKTARAVCDDATVLEQLTRTRNWAAATGSRQQSREKA